jgi:hypothetical protein
MKVLNKGDILYFSRIIPKTGIYDVCELYIRTVEETYFVGIDKKDKQAHIFGYDRINEDIFDNRKDALNKVQRAEKNKKYGEPQEVYYEQY